MSLLSELILMYVKFRVIQRKYGNISANGKFCGSARNSVARRKVWSLFVIAYLSSCGYVYLNVAVGEAAWSSNRGSAASNNFAVEMCSWSDWATCCEYRTDKKLYVVINETFGLVNLDSLVFMPHSWMGDCVFMLSILMSVPRAVLAISQPAVLMGKSIPVPIRTRLQLYSCDCDFWSRGKLCKKWNSAQGGQVHYADATAVGASNEHGHWAVFSILIY